MESDTRVKLVTVIVGGLVSVAVAFITTYATIALLRSGINKADKRLVNIEKDLDGLVDTVSQRTLPIGSIVASVLKPSQFAKAVGDPGNFDPKTSGWLPADKRNVSGSQYAELTGRTTAPDLRGVFVRGLNAFEEGNPRTDKYKDPDGTRKVGEFQLDEVGKHKHTSKEATFTRGVHYTDGTMAGMA